MADNQQNYATPSSVRSVTSYPARRGFKQGPVDPSVDHVIGVEDSIDIHCHAHEGQQDPMAIAKLASASGMRGIVYKTLVGATRKDLVGPAGGVREMEGELAKWCEANKCEPIRMWAPYLVRIAVYALWVAPRKFFR